MGEYLMPNDDELRLIVYFCRNDGRRERIALTHDTGMADAVTAVKKVFYISAGLYTKAEICRGNKLVETVANASCVRLASILIQ